MIRRVCDKRGLQHKCLWLSTSGFGKMPSTKKLMTYVDCEQAVAVQAGEK